MKPERDEPEAHSVSVAAGSQYVYPKIETVIQTVYFIALHVQDYADKRPICAYASLLQLDFDEMIMGGREVRGADRKSRCRSRSPKPFCFI
jgi:hypothetical protein